MEELAATYIREMRAFYPQGPYLLGVQVMEDWLPMKWRNNSMRRDWGRSCWLCSIPRLRGMSRRVDPKDQAVDLLAESSQRGFPYLTRKATVKRKYWWEKLERRAQVAAGAAYRLAGKPLPLSLHYIEVEEAHWRALMRYTFLPYAGKVTLMRAVDRGPEVLGKREDPTLGRGPLASVLRFMTFPPGICPCCLHPT